MLALDVRAFSAAKLGNSEEEYEDAFSHDALFGRFAIADGASESSFARRWAELLAQGYVSLPPSLSRRRAQRFLEWLRPLREEWRATIPWATLPWYAEQKARAGAFSSLLGVCVPGRPSAAKRRWSAVAIGDSCLFHVRGPALLRAFPTAKSSGFGNSPFLLRSIADSRQSPLQGVVFAQGRCRPGDTFVLATDALAQWLLAATEAGQNPWGATASIPDQASFAAWVATLRAERLLRNDDVTLMVIEVRDALASAL